MKTLTLSAIVFLFCVLAESASAQQFDVAFGVGTVSASSAKTVGALTFPSQSGGAYPGFSADFLLRHRFGIEGEMSWRASQAMYGFQPYRPIFYSFNAIWVPRLNKNVSAELLAGIGGEDVRFYGILNCNGFVGCTTYASSNHFMGDFGGGIRAYIWRNVFIRPEVRVYLINNNVEFSSGHAIRYGGSLGISFGR